MNGPDTKKVKQLLTEAPIGKYLGEYGIEVFAKCASVELTLCDNELLFEQGDTDNTFYIVKSGRLARFVQVGQQKRERVLHIFERGDLMGELSFIDGMPHSSSVKALGEVSVICFKEEDIKPLVTEEPEVMYCFLRAIITRVHSTLADIIEQQLALSSYIAGVPSR